MKKNVIRILIISDSLVRGGRERRLIELLKNIEHNPLFKVDVVLLKNVIQYPEIFELKNIELTVIERRIKKDPSVFYKLYRICKKNNYDIIHSWGSMPSVYTFLTAKLLNTKFINAMIADAVCPRFGSSWWRKIITFPFSDAIVANSLAGINAYHVPGKKARVINNGFDFKRVEDLINPELIRKKYNIRTKYVIGMVAAFSKYKDYDTIIMAAQQILEAGLDITFLLIGDGENINFYKNNVKPEWENYILFPGNLENVESVINVFDIGVLTTYTEGISNSIMEYMALGKPVIATDGGGTSELVINNETGFIINHGSVKELVEKIKFFIKNPHEMKKMGLSGKDRIKKRYSIDRMVDQTISLYHDVLSRNN